MSEEAIQAYKKYYGILKYKGEDYFSTLNTQASESMERIAFLDANENGIPEIIYFTVKYLDEDFFRTEFLEIDEYIDGNLENYCELTTAIESSDLCGSIEHYSVNNQPELIFFRNNGGYLSTDQWIFDQTSHKYIANAEQLRFAEYYPYSMANDSGEDIYEQGDRKITKEKYNGLMNRLNEQSDQIVIYKDKQSYIPQSSEADICMTYQEELDFLIEILGDDMEEADTEWLSNDSVFKELDGYNLLCHDGPWAESFILHADGSFTLEENTVATSHTHHSSGKGKFIVAEEIKQDVFLLEITGFSGQFEASEYDYQEGTLHKYTGDLEDKNGERYYLIMPGVEITDLAGDYYSSFAELLNGQGEIRTPVLWSEKHGRDLYYQKSSIES